MTINDKEPAKIVFIKDPKALALINERAAKENRSAANAATTTVIEALSQNDTGDKDSRQDKNRS